MKNLGYVQYTQVAELNNIIATLNNDNISLRFEVTDDIELGESKVTVFENNKKITESPISKFQIHE